MSDAQPVGAAGAEGKTIAFGPGWFRQLLGYAGASTAVGAGLTWLIDLVAGGGSAHPRVVLAGGLVGLCACVFCFFPLELLGGRLQALPTVLRQLGRGLLLVFGGLAGWTVATRLSALLLGIRFNIESRELVVIVSLTIGAAFITYDQLSSRLRTSLEQLKQREIERAELELAGEIQRRLLPPEQISGDGYRVVARHRPARYVAGDFYDVFHLSDGSLAVVVADVVGKGMGASLIMATVKAMVPLLAADRAIADTARELNCRLYRELAPREFVAMLLMRLEPAGGTLELVNAGLPDPYLRSNGGEVTAVDSEGPRLPIGVRRDVAYQSKRLTMSPGEGLLAMTDGIPEAMTVDDAPLGYSALQDLLDGGPCDPVNWIDGWLKEVEQRTVTGLDDDWTIIFAQMTERAGAASSG